MQGRELWGVLKVFSTLKQSIGTSVYFEHYIVHTSVQELGKNKTADTCMNCKGREPAYLSISRYVENENGPYI